MTNAPTSNQVGAREFWVSVLDVTGNPVDVSAKPFQDEAKFHTDIHVIEYQALIDERKRVEGLVAAFKTLRDKYFQQEYGDVYLEQADAALTLYNQSRVNSDNIDEYAQAAKKRGW